MTRKRSSKKSTSGRVTPKGTRPPETSNSKRSSTPSTTGRTPKPADQRLKHQESKQALRTDSRSGRRGQR